MLSIRKVTVLLGTIAIAACADKEPSPLSAPRSSANAPSYDVSSATRSHAGRQRITGHADFLVANEGNIAEEFSVDAKPDPDAPSNAFFTFARGNLEYGSAHGPNGFRIHGEMYCFKVENNRANLAARVTESTNPNVHAGDYLTWRIQDNDERHGNPPDMTTQLFLSDATLATSFCAFGGDPTHPFFPIKGNLEIHDH